MGRRYAKEVAADVYSSSRSMSCMRMNAGMEKPPLTRSRVTQLSYPITRTDPELSAVSFCTSYDAVLYSVTTLYIPRAIVLQMANKTHPLAPPHN
jgi:hypothetical protein